MENNKGNHISLATVFSTKIHNDYDYLLNSGVGGRGSPAVRIVSRRTDPHLKLTRGGVDKLKNDYRFPGGGVLERRGSPAMTTIAVTARRKVDPQHMLREKSTILF